MQTNSKFNDVVIWSKPNCPGCTQAKSLLDSRGIAYSVKMLGENATRKELFEAVPTARTVPQIFVNGEHIGGLPELRNFIG